MKEGTLLSVYRTRHHFDSKLPFKTIIRPAGRSADYIQSTKHNKGNKVSLTSKQLYLCYLKFNWLSVEEVTSETKEQ